MNQVKSKSRTLWGKGIWILVFGWIIFVYGSYIYFWRENILWESLGNTFLRIFLLLIFVLASIALGRKILRWLKFESSFFLESCLFGLTIGLAIVTFAVIGFGLAGLLNRWVISLFFIGVYALTYDEIGNIVRQTKTKFKSSLAALRIPSVEVVLLLILAIQIFFNLVGASVMPSGWDNLGEHLAIAKEWTRLNRLTSVPYINLTQWAQPFNMGILYAMALLLKDAILANLIHFAFGILTAVGIYAFGKRYFSPRVGLLAAVIFYMTPVASYISSVACADIGLTFYTFLAFYALINWITSNKKGWLLISAIISGLALGSKYAGVPLTAILSSGILFSGWFLKKEKFLKIAKNFFVFIALAGLIGSFWYVRAYIVAGRPLFGIWQGYLFKFWRMIKGLWASGFLNLGTAQPAFALNLSLPEKVITLPWNVSMHSGRLPGIGDIGIVFLAFLPFLLLPRCRKSKLIKFMLYYSVVFFVLWATFATYRRYIIPIFPLLGLMVAYIVEGLPSSRGGLKKGLYGVLILSLVFQMFYLPAEGLSKIYQRILVFAGLKSQEEYILRNEETYRVFKYINENSPPEAKVWVAYEPRTFYCDRPYVTFLKLGRASSAEEFLVQLKRAGITHFVFNQGLWQVRHGGQSKYPELIEKIKPQYLDTVYEKDSFVIWRLSYPSGLIE